MITNLCIWWLRKRKVSVLIGYKTYFGTLKQLSNEGYIYDNELNHTNYINPNGKRIHIPDGEFEIKSEK